MELKIELNLFKVGQFIFYLFIHLSFVFLLGDFLQLAPTLTADIVYLSPPWGGPSYGTIDLFDLEKDIELNGYRIFETAKKITSNIVYFLPRNVNVEQVISLMDEKSPLELEQNFLNNRLKTITAYFGDLAKQTNSS